MAILVAFYGKNHTFNRFKIYSNFFGEPFLFFFITAKNLNVLRNLTVSVALYSKIATSSHFRKINFFWKTHLFFRTAQIFWNFWEIWRIELHSAANLPASAIFENFKVFSRKTHLFLQKNPTFESFEKSYCSVRIRHPIG